MVLRGQARPVSHDGKAETKAENQRAGTVRGCGAGRDKRTCSEVFLLESDSVPEEDLETAPAGGHKPEDCGLNSACRPVSVTGHHNSAVSQTAFKPKIMVSAALLPSELGSGRASAVG